jgi:hypothetical protein
MPPPPVAFTTYFIYSTLSSPRIASEKAAQGSAEAPGAGFWGIAEFSATPGVFRLFHEDSFLPTKAKYTPDTSIP